MKRILALFLTLFTVLPLSGCGEKETIERYRGSFYGTFDTVVTVIGYATDSRFDQGLALLQTEMERYHALFDKYHEYEGINNIKTINDQAGVAPVVVAPELFDFLSQGKEWYRETSGKVNIAYGPVLSIWHTYRERYQGNEQGQLPSQEELEAAAKFTDIDQLILDPETSTAYLAQPGMSLDVGAVAKGYAIERAGQALYDSGLMTSFILSGGGNVRVFDAPLDENRISWGVGIQDPKQDPNLPEQTYLDTVFANRCSVVTSGNYQRFYLADGKRIHHIIDPATHFPADRYAAVTVVCEDSGQADLLSTALYILDVEEGRALAQEQGAKVLWVFEDGSMEMTEDLIPLLQNRGGATSVAPGKEPANG